MAKHDFGTDCDCRECRTTMFSVPCPSCEFETTVSYVRGGNGQSTDKKGRSYYEFEEIKSAGYELSCFKCGYHISDVSYYEKIEVLVNQAKQKREKARTCEECGKKEFSSIFDEEYIEWKGQILCDNCRIKKVKSELTDPSTEGEKHVFNPKSLRYELKKIRTVCADCGNKMWIGPDERWKKKCITCYKKTNSTDIDKFKKLFKKK